MSLWLIIFGAVAGIAVIVALRTRLPQSEVPSSEGATDWGGYPASGAFDERHRAARVARAIARSR